MYWQTHFSYHRDKLDTRSILQESFDATCSTLCKLNWRIDRTLELTSDALTNVGKHFTLNVACACSQWITKDSVFWLAQFMCIMTFHTLLPFIRPNVISCAPTNGLSICQLTHGPLYKQTVNKVPWVILL